MNLSSKSVPLHDVRAPHPRISSLLLLCYLLLCLLPFALAWDATKLLFALVLGNDTFSQIPLIPLVSLYLIYERRISIFADVSFGGIFGASLIVPGLVLIGVGRLNPWQLGSTNLVSLLMLAVLLIWLGGFALFFGAKAFRSACFPLLFLIFIIPIPEPLLSKIVYFLQVGSSAMAEIFFKMLGMPYLRQEGFIFQLPGVAIRVAEECSGIRSSLALLITTVLASYIFLRTAWRRVLLCCFVLPMVIVKNGLRIATLSALSIYVNPGFLTGRLHHQGGFVFFAVALFPMALILILLQKNEGRRPASIPSSQV